MTAPKSSRGNFFEDFRLGQVFAHATPRTITAGDVALYTALTGARFALQSSDEFARAIGYPQAPVDDLMVFHMVFGKTVADISLNAVANLGYAECRFLAPVFPGDTLSARSAVIGLKQTSSGEAGIVWVRTCGFNQRQQPVLEYARWVMVAKRDRAAAAPEAVVPTLGDRVDPAGLGPELPQITLRNHDVTASGAPHLWPDYEPGEWIDHVEGVTIEEAEHQLATRLYQNPAKVHFDAPAGSPRSMAGGISGHALQATRYMPRRRSSKRPGFPADRTSAPSEPGSMASRTTLPAAGRCTMPPASSPPRSCWSWICG
jgi:2-methylfumaryl-CoA hydratase